MTYFISSVGRKFYQDDRITIYNTTCESILRAIPGGTIDAILTDPPYGIGYKSNKPRLGGQYSEIVGDDKVSTDILGEFYRVLRDKTACYLFTRWDVMDEWRQAMIEAGFIVKNELIWDKGGFGMGDLEGDWATTHETILYCTKGDHKLNPPRRKSVISARKVTPSAMIHPNEKPLGVWYPMISASTKPGDIVLDPYAGTCSSTLACRQLNRNSIGVEVDLGYLESALPRLQQTELLRTS